MVGVAVGVAVQVAVAAGVYFFGGFYSVAAIQEDPAVVKWALTNVRTASINRSCKSGGAVDTTARPRAVS